MSSGHSQTVFGMRWSRSQEHRRLVGVDECACVCAVCMCWLVMRDGRWMQQPPAEWPLVPARDSWPPSPGHCSAPPTATDVRQPHGRTASAPSYRSGGRRARVTNTGDAIAPGTVPTPHPHRGCQHSASGGCAHPLPYPCTLSVPGIVSGTAFQGSASPHGQFGQAEGRGGGVDRRVSKPMRDGGRPGDGHATTRNDDGTALWWHNHRIPARPGREGRGCPHRAPPRRMRVLNGTDGRLLQHDTKKVDHDSRQRPPCGCHRKQPAGKGKV